MESAVRRRGRPRVTEPRQSVSTWIPQRQHDRLIKFCLRHDKSMSAVVKRAIVVFLKDDSSGPQE